MKGKGSVLSTESEEFKYAVIKCLSLSQAAANVCAEKVCTSVYVCVRLHRSTTQTYIQLHVRKFKRSIQKVP